MRSPGLGREAQLLQTARRVVQLDQQRAAMAARLEPRVVGTVDSDQLADACAASPWLLGALATFAPRLPQANLAHPVHSASVTARVLSNLTPY